MKRPALVVIHPAACRAYGLPEGTRAPAGAVIITADATELIAMESGALMPRPTPLPWTRPSWAAIPSLVTR